VIGLVAAASISGALSDLPRLQDVPPLLRFAESPRLPIETGMVRS